MNMQLAYDYGKHPKTNTNLDEGTNQGRKTQGSTRMEDRSMGSKTKRINHYNILSLHY